MKKTLSIIIALFLLLFTFRNSYAQSNPEYVISEFSSLLVSAQKSSRSSWSGGSGFSGGSSGGGFGGSGGGSW